MLTPEQKAKLLQSEAVLTPEQILDLEATVDFILEFEETDYLDWQRETGKQTGHVYYHAKKLWDEILLPRLKE
jgi:hypothetical protein